MTHAEIMDEIVTLIVLGGVLNYPHLTTYFTSPHQPLLISQMAGYIAGGKR